MIRCFEPDDVDFALAQKLREGWAVSRDQFVLYLEHDPDAHSLIAAAVTAAAGRPVLIGLPALNTQALAILTEMGFDRGASSFRMRLGPPLAAADPTRMVAIASGAVGCDHRPWDRPRGRRPSRATLDPGSCVDPQIAKRVPSARGGLSCDLDIHRLRRQFRC